MGEEQYDITKIIPSTDVIDKPLATKQRFIDEVKKLGVDKLPQFFPAVPELNRAKNDFGVTMNDDYREHQLTLPFELYNSNTYNANLSLRGPLEEIILAYERKRTLYGFKRGSLVGDGWSEKFRSRFEKLTPKLGRSELGEPLDDEKLLEHPSGSKIA